jgi:hypothetical protein
MTKTCLVAIVLGLLPPARAQSLSAGEGKEALQRVCTACHGLEFTVGSKRSRVDWQAVVNNMIEAGADRADAEMKQIVNYLATNFGPSKPTVNVNKSITKELADGLEISTKEAEAIVQYRADHGDFLNLSACGKSKLLAWLPKYNRMELFYAWPRSSAVSNVQLLVA